VPSDSSLAAERHRNALLHQHARLLVHEISNLMFLSEIQARQPASAAGDELRRALPLTRRLARLLADALAPDPKPRTLSVAEAVEELETLLVKPSRAQVAPCEIALATAATGKARFRELPGALLLLVQVHLRPPSPAAPMTRIEISLAPGAIVVALAPATGAGIDRDFVVHEAARNRFRAELDGDRLRLVLPEAGEDG
jgi:hypothetical protein